MNSQNLTPLSQEQIDSYVKKTLETTEKVFKWSEVDTHFIWSALLASDSIATIGFKPTSIKHFNTNSHMLDLNDYEWKLVREKIKSVLLSVYRIKYGDSFDISEIMPFGERSDRPYINLKLHDYDIIALLMRMPEVRYVEPLGYSLLEEVEKSSSGCDNYQSPINASDYIPISPTSRQSWHQLKANVDLAWTDSNKGEGIWIAVLDTGVSSSQEKLGSEFDEGDSGNRSIEKIGLFAPGGVPDGWNDQCGHGTAMVGLAVAPRGFDNTPAGIAYKSNVISYRVTEDVVINSSTEKNGVSDGLYAAGDSTKVKIISMSIGDVFYNSQVADAVIYANNKGKMILAAAGTSFSATSWYGVIFPANMNETIAITGTKDNSPRSKCDACHDGSEVDFIIEMERQNDNTRHGVTLAQGNHEQGYVGGSSCATASYAGIAALIWGNNPSWDKGQVLNRMIQTADYYPNRDGDFGWGQVDVSAAVDTSFSLPCESNLSNELTMEVTNISFPATTDPFTSEAEWVISFNGESHFFDVPVGGASGNPASFINLGVCGFIPITVDLGTTTCGEDNLNITIESFEDDGFFSDCDYDSGDDDYALTVENVVFSNSSITHTSPAGDFVISYTLSCIPTATPSASINQDTTVCTTDGDVALVVYASGGTAPYTVECELDGVSLPDLIFDVTDTIWHSPVSVGTYLYSLKSVVDANGCSQVLNGTAEVIVNGGIVGDLEDDSPQSVGNPISFIASPPGQSKYDFFHDMNGNDTLDVGESLQVGPSEHYENSNLEDGDTICVIILTSEGCYDQICNVIEICPLDYSSSGNGKLTGTVSDIKDYETDGVIDSDQLIESTAKVDYDSGAEINLLNGFEVEVGAEILMFIDGCNGEGGLINLKNSNGNSKK